LAAMPAFRNVNAANIGRTLSDFVARRYNNSFNER